MYVPTNSVYENIGEGSAEDLGQDGERRGGGEGGSSSVGSEEEGGSVLFVRQRHR